MASYTTDLLRSLLIKYAGVPNQEAVALNLEYDEIRKYATEAALLADVANVVAGTICYAIDTQAYFVRGTSAFVALSDAQSDARSYLLTKVSLTNAEIKALAASPKTLIAAPGAGKALLLHDAFFKLDHGGTNDFTVGGGDDLAIKYVDDSGLAATGTIETTGWIDSSADAYQLVKGAAVAVATAAQCVNVPLVLDNVGSEIAGNAGNDNTLDVWLRYSIVTV